MDFIIVTALQKLPFYWFLTNPMILMGKWSHCPNGLGPPYSCLFTPGLGTEVPKAPSCPRALHSLGIRKLHLSSSLASSLWPNFPLKSTRRLSFMSKKGPSSPRPISTLTLGARSKSRPTFTGLLVGWPWTPHTPDSRRLQPIPRHPCSLCPRGWCCGCLWCPTRMQCQEGDSSLALHCSEQ